MAYSIRTQKQATTKYTPFFFMFGRNPRSPREVLKLDLFKNYFMPRAGFRTGADSGFFERGAHNLKFSNTFLLLFMWRVLLFKKYLVAKN